jgi:hypothetical protein
MTLPIRSAVTRWRAGLLHPVTRYGFDMLREGGRRRSGGRMGTGLAMIAAGVTLGRIRPAPQRIYRAGLEVDESIGIRVVRSGEVVGETVVTTEEI